MTTPLAARIAREYGTPAAVIDMDRVERNIARIQAACDAAGVANRPHIKTHKSPLIATMQIKAGAGSPQTGSKRRLNFNEKHALETLPKTIAKLQAEIAKQQRILDDPDLYKKNRKKFDTASDALTQAQKELQEAEDKWLELEVLREEIEQA